MWRDTALRLTVLGLDALVLVPIALFVFHIRWWTLYVMCAGLVFFIALRWFGLTPPTFARRLRCFFAGAVRPAVERRHRRRLA